METTTVRSMVTEDFRSAAIFEKHSIDFCCHGNVPLEQACSEKGVSIEKVRADLKTLSTDSPRGLDSFDSWDLDRLAEYIIQTHHRYVRSAIPTLLAHTEKVALVHGERHAELAEIRDIFKSVADEMTTHMMKEERVLFPFIKELAQSARNGQPVQSPPFQTIQNPIRMMEAEHVSAGGGMEDIRNASLKYAIPADACMTYRITYKELEAFEVDLHKHVHLENNILFPKAIELEQQMLTAFQLH
jgi:regulator of cell morphogenesis and NO signaling